MVDRMQAAAELRRALQLYAQDLARAETDDSTMMEIASLYPDYQVGRAYTEIDVIKYGVNTDGEAQLYRVRKPHTSQADWPPDTTTDLYKAIGYTEDGTAIWTQPLGAHDAYDIGDEVMYTGASYPQGMYRSKIPANTTEPGSDVRWWEFMDDRAKAK